eukprot:TRINITY_DN156_c0_g1_i4.p1 TRINITY_DN156_c0_g1~~TRINITY_DN156_c0_g1_i4.p1  ORF type:complete len:139 (-),score=51.01 TRINITY_DN156_c0_g1_i4:199-591(-)
MGSKDPDCLDMKFFLVALLAAVATADLEKHQEELVAKFGAKNVNFDKNVRTQFCDQCTEITVTSTGGAMEHQPQRIATYVKEGSLWENMMPFWKSDNNQYIHPRPIVPTPSCTTSSGLCPKVLEGSMLDL